MSLSEEQKNEVIRLKKIAKQYEGIIRTSRNVEQQTRAKKDLKKVLDQIELIAPGGAADKIEASSTTSAPRRTQDSVVAETQILKKFVLSRLHPSVEDADLNLLSSVFQIWEEEFMRTLSESHVKLDFSSGAERDAHFSLVENVKRQKKILVETIDDFARASREDVKHQLREMKSRYSRHYLKEGSAALKTLRDFWTKVSNGLHDHSGVCLNPEEEVVFNSKFETPTRFEGVRVSDVVEETSGFLKEAVSLIRTPDF